MEQRPKVFIGSSKDGLSVAYAIQQNLTSSAEVTVWDQGVFELSQTTIESLLDILEKSDFGIFVFLPDDIVKIKDKNHLTVRDNVIFELGLFIGKLGRKRSFVVSPDGIELHIPTDLLGVTTGRYEPNRSDGSMQAATGPVCHTIRQRIASVGPVERNIDNSATSVTVDESKENKIEDSNESIEENDNFFEYFFDNDYKKALELLQREADKIEEDNIDDIYSNQLWQLHCKIALDKEKILQLVDAFLLNDRSVKFYEAASRILSNNHFNKKALEIIDAGLTRYANNPDLLLIKADLLLKEDQQQKAIDILTTELNHFPAADIKLANYYEQEGDLEKALITIHRAYNKFPTLESIMYNYGRLCLASDKDEISLYLLDRLVSINSSNASYWTYLGNACLNNNLHDKALASYRKAERLSESKEGWILANIGNTFNNRGLFSEAKLYFQKALDINKEHEYAIKRLSHSLESLKKEDAQYESILKSGRNLMRDYDKEIYKEDN